MVAAGGGGHDAFKFGGSGGGLQGFDSDGKGGNQTSGGDGLYPGNFGLGGGNGERTLPNGTPDGNAGGGGGYFGGGTSFGESYGSAGCGSSYISGYPGCISVAEDFKILSPKFSSQADPSIHFSGIKFENPIMIDGNSLMPAPFFDKVITRTGNIGNGHVIISSVDYHNYPKIHTIPYRVLCSIPLKIPPSFDGTFLFSLLNISHD
ncbi:type II keratin, putative [Trichomonas vaginalis G3]|uniref:receptor protein-tyrosine kinase n=1 Tax=Trichomonas vaginalis (strain ATCC PRA-98 / G3) TaxID=412133 RepID=A2G9K0_TRIV3|nr:glycine-rich protein family [Trichomonas vaginalis G3]EAX86168.1 type II keratin, putative [Trichomonas vaginalis G3]KAI5522863.1 glycine-rich protein family [Trichomonas vaginalis G3]|eukprot:XP_001299098.1 type II keratin [Trichomonas vaginalis G3]